MEPTNWMGLAAVLITTIGSVAGMWGGRTRTTVQDVPVDAPSSTPAQVEGAWTVSPEMYKWVIEFAQRESNTRAERLEFLLGLALVHIDRQEGELKAAGLPSVPMDPELVAARDSR
ncbi:hypothetical protein ACFRDV_21920 [Streptomyces fagopyri]|uniref:hypothetical protein n=1 Tax=Streptomyces fagopyri TaxID=2662397 RepID=UPI00368D02F2